MSHGLGSVQRLMLFRLADHELRIAEAAAERQLPYRPPDRWSLNTLMFSTFYDHFLGLQRRNEGWQELLRQWEEGGPWDSEIQRLNPGRAISGLERRGFVARDRYRRKSNIGLTAEGFVEARRLGGVRASEIVDLDQVQASWREREDFGLALGPYASRRDDDPPEAYAGVPAVRQILWERQVRIPAVLNG